MTRIAATAIVLLVMLGAGARADDKPQNTLPPRAITHHTIVLNGRHIDYDAIAEPLDLTDRQGKTTAQIFTVSYLAQPRGRRRAPGQLCVQRRTRRRLGVFESRRARTQDHGDPGQWRCPEPAGAPRRQRVELAALHRPRLYRPGRHRLQPRRGQRKKSGSAVLGCRKRSLFARRDDQAVADPASALGCAGLSGRRELRRVPRRRNGAAAAA